MNSRHLVSAALALALSAPAFAEGDWLIRGRAVRLDMDNSSSAEVLPADAISVNDKTIPEVDINYYLTKNIRLELVLTIPQEQDVTVTGLGKIGTFKHLPPTFTVAYEFNAGSNFRPYVGAGINYTLFSDEKMHTALGNVTLENDSVGFAVQAGFDYAINKDWVFNVDIKKVQLGTDVKLDGAKISELDVDPLLIGIGFGKVF